MFINSWHCGTSSQFMSVFLNVWLSLCSPSNAKQTVVQKAVSAFDHLNGPQNVVHSLRKATCCAGQRNGAASSSGRGSTWPTRSLGGKGFAQDESGMKAAQMVSCI